MGNDHSEPHAAQDLPEQKPKWQRPIIERIGLEATLFNVGSPVDLSNSGATG